MLSCLHFHAWHSSFTLSCLRSCFTFSYFMLSYFPLSFSLSCFHPYISHSHIPHSHIFLTLSPSFLVHNSPLGQPLTQAGVPQAFFMHSSHFCTAPSSEGKRPFRAAYQYAGITAYAPVLVYGNHPSTTVSAPVMQDLTHNGS